MSTATIRFLPVIRPHTELSAVNEDIIKSTADIMIETGLNKAGYEYLVIDGKQDKNQQS